MTFLEFQRVMFDAGISWLNEQEMHSKFEAMDIDNSGKLNLAEVFSAATRMQSLVERARDYEKDQIALGRKLTQVEVMEEFSMVVLTGDDLSNLPQVKINVSSGQQTKQWLRLEAREDAWLPDADDLDKWIEWDFGTPCNVTTVSTSGHPLKDTWVTKYNLEFWEERRVEPELKGKEVTYFEMRRALVQQYQTEEEMMAHWETLKHPEGSAGS